MNILLITQNAPLYLPWFLDQFVARARADGHTVLLTRLSPAHGRSLWREASRRLAFYGPRAFLIATGRIVLARLASKWPAAVRRGRCFSVENVMARHGIVEWKTTSVNDPAFTERIRSGGIDLIVSVAAPEIFRKDLLSAPRSGCLNYHTALLPRHRGRQPLFWALLEGDAETGVSVHKMNEQLDDGPIYGQRRVLIEPGDTLDDLYLKTMRVGVEALVDAVSMVARGERAAIPNPREQATQHRFPSREDARAFRRAGKHFF